MSESYTILLSGLKEGRHIVDFEIGKEFFEQFEDSEVAEGSLIANIEIERRSSLLDLVIRISGNLNVSCDRCLEIYSQPVLCENRLLVKFGKSIADDDPDVLSVSADDHELDLKQHLYEYILLALPIKRVHPDDEKGNSTCDPVMLQKILEHTVEKNVYTDPRWEELKRLMNDN